MTCLDDYDWSELKMDDVLTEYIKKLPEYTLKDHGLDSDELEWRPSYYRHCEAGDTIY